MISLMSSNYGFAQRHFLSVAEHAGNLWLLRFNDSFNNNFTQRSCKVSVCHNLIWFIDRKKIKIFDAFLFERCLRVNELLKTLNQLIRLGSLARASLFIAKSFASSALRGMEIYFLARRAYFPLNSRRVRSALTSSLSEISESHSSSISSWNKKKCFDAKIRARDKTKS